MNVTFRLPNEALEKRVRRRGGGARAWSAGGHRSVGGIRASIYNAVPPGGGPDPPVVHGALPDGYPLTMQVSVRLSPGSSWMSLSI